MSIRGGMVVNNTNQISGHTVLAIRSIAGAFCRRPRQHQSISSRLGWLLHLATLYRRSTRPADTTIRSASDHLSMLLGRRLRDRARLGFGTLAGCELLAACI